MKKHSRSMMIKDFFRVVGCTIFTLIAFFAGLIFLYEAYANRSFLFLLYGLLSLIAMLIGYKLSGNAGPRYQKVLEQAYTDKIEKEKRAEQVKQRLDKMKELSLYHALKPAGSEGSDGYSDASGDGASAVTNVQVQQMLETLLELEKEGIYYSVYRPELLDRVANREISYQAFQEQVRRIKKLHRKEHQEEEKLEKPAQEPGKKRGEKKVTLHQVTCGGCGAVSMIRSDSPIPCAYCGRELKIWKSVSKG